MDDDGLDRKFWWQMAGAWLVLAVLCILGLVIFSRWTVRFGIIGAFAIVIVILGFLAWRHDRKEQARYDDERTDSPPHGGHVDASWSPPTAVSMPSLRQTR